MEAVTAMMPDTIGPTTLGLIRTVTPPREYWTEYRRCKDQQIANTGYVNDAIGSIIDDIRHAMRCGRVDFDLNRRICRRLWPYADAYRRERMNELLLPYDRHLPV